MDTNNWEYFKYSDIFTILKGKRLIKEDMNDGITPYIGAIDSENGCREFIDKEPIFKSNAITVNYNGSIAKAFYQSKAFWASDDCNILYSDKLNKYNALFLIPIIEKEAYRYNYGRKWHKERMENSFIKLPIDNKGNPNWVFMESYIKERLLKQPTKEPYYNKIVSLKDREWEWFKYKDVFILEKTKPEHKINLEEGSYRYVTRTKFNNGVEGFFNGININKKNCISIGGESAIAFYQDKEFISGNNITILKNSTLNKYNVMFLLTLLNKELYRYNYGRARNLDRLRNEDIKLPIDSEGQPDYQFMEYYIKSLPYSKNLEGIKMEESKEELSQEEQDFEDLIDLASLPLTSDQ